MAKLVVLLALVAFASSVLANPHGGGPYGHRHGVGWYRYPPGPYDGPRNDSSIIVIIQDSPTSSAAVTPAPSSAAPAAAASSTDAQASSTGTTVAAG